MFTTSSFSTHATSSCIAIFNVPVHNLDAFSSACTPQCKHIQLQYSMSQLTLPALFGPTTTMVFIGSRRRNTPLTGYVYESRPNLPNNLPLPNLCTIFSTTISKVGDFGSSEMGE